MTKKAYMKHTTKLSLTISLLLGSQAAFALTPWTDTPEITIYTSGGAAQDKAYGEVVKKTLAASGTLDIFDDVNPKNGNVGSRWTSYFFIGNDKLGAGLAGKKILLEKRIAGAAGYGVVPVVAGIPIEHLNVIGSKAADWTANGVGQWKAEISSTNGSKYLTKKVSDAGFLGVDPDSLLKPGTENYPTPVNEVITGKPEAKWPLNIKMFPKSGERGFTVIPTGGLVYGVAVTQDLYQVLQVAQRRAGILSSDAKVGGYSEADLPTLNRNVLGSFFAGKIGNWEQFQFVDKTDGNKVKSLLDTDVLKEAVVVEPTKNTEKLTPVGVGRRNNGAAIGAVAYAKLLNYPGTANSIAPALPTPNKLVDENASLPIVKSPTGTSDTGNLLKDWQAGTNISGYNNVIDGAGNARIWGLAFNSADRNNSVKADGTGGDGWRYIKVDGYAPTLENVAAGNYPLWAEGSFIYRTKNSADKTWESKTKLLKTLADDLGSPTVANLVNTTQPWGKTGIFATTADPRGFVNDVPFQDSNPVVPFSHIGSDGLVHLEIAPVADSNAKGGLALQLK
jgi:hypothetical protein